MNHPIVQLWNKHYPVGSDVVLKTEHGERKVQIIGPAEFKSDAVPPVTIKVRDGVVQRTVDLKDLITTR